MQEIPSLWTLNRSFLLSSFELELLFPHLIQNTVYKTPASYLSKRSALDWISINYLIVFRCPLLPVMVEPAIPSLIKDSERVFMLQNHWACLSLYAMIFTVRTRVAIDPFLSVSTWRLRWTSKSAQATDLPFVAYTLRRVQFISTSLELATPVTPSKLHGLPLGALLVVAGLLHWSKTLLLYS